MGTLSRYADIYIANRIKEDLVADDVYVTNSLDIDDVQRPVVLVQRGTPETEGYRLLRVDLGFDVLTLTKDHDSGAVISDRIFQAFREIHRITIPAPPDLKMPEYEGTSEQPPDILFSRIESVSGPRPLGPDQKGIYVWQASYVATFADRELPIGSNS